MLESFLSGSASWPSMHDTDPRAFWTLVSLVDEEPVSPRLFHQLLSWDVHGKPEQVGKAGTWVPAVTGQSEDDCGDSRAPHSGLPER